MEREYRLSEADAPNNFAPDVAHHRIHRVARMQSKESVKALGVTTDHFKAPQ